jgi:hypothetical protein
MKLPEDGKTEQEIIVALEGDEQLVKMWIGFLVHNRWIEKPNGKWFATAKGKVWAEKYS